MLRVENLSKSYDGYIVLDDIDFSVEKGEVVALLGPSGSGKTTLLRCISFLEKADRGKITFGDIYGNMPDMDSKRIRDIRLQMGFVFQSFNLFRNMTVLENVIEGLITARRAEKEKALDKAKEVLRKVGMLDKMSYYPDELSGGQQQRAAIARALALDPDLILLDEPTSALDPELTGEVLDTISELAREGTTMVVVTHEMNFAREVASRVVFMEDGHIVEEGKTEHIFSEAAKERTRQFIRMIK